MPSGIGLLCHAQLAPDSKSPDIMSDWSPVILSSVGKKNPCVAMCRVENSLPDKALNDSSLALEPS